MQFNEFYWLHWFVGLGEGKPPYLEFARGNMVTLGLYSMGEDAKV
jgi:hypothetical protein